MAEYVTLMGAEQVGRAGQAMKQAADEMNRAASNIHEALHRQWQDLSDHQNFLNDWLERFAAIVKGDK